MRGVHLLNASSVAPMEGSSPHARGPPGQVSGYIPGNRIIPACAGSTFYGIFAQSLPKDHPRMRGVHVGRIAEKRKYEGSSPHARGPPFVDWRNLTVARIIPACAGSTAIHGLPAPCF